MERKIRYHSAKQPLLLSPIQLSVTIWHLVVKFRHVAGRGPVELELLARKLLPRLAVSCHADGPVRAAAELALFCPVVKLIHVVH